MASEPKKSCFVICPIGAKDSPERRWSDDIYGHLIAPIADEFGYTANRTIDDSRPGEITPGIVTALIESDLVVADLTNLNPNVLYELAIRHWTGKPFIHMAAVGTKLPFDITTINFVEIDVGSFSGMERSREHLAKHFSAVNSGKASYENPVSRYQDRIKLNQNPDPIAKQLAHFQQTQERMATEIARLRDEAERRRSREVLQIASDEVVRNILASGATPGGLGSLIFPRGDTEAGYFPSAIKVRLTDVSGKSTSGAEAPKAPPTPNAPSTAPGEKK